MRDVLAYARQGTRPARWDHRGLVAFFIGSADMADLSGVVIGARVVAPADAQDPSQGQYGVFYTAVPRGQGFTTSAWVDGLQQNEENRSNLALVNTGEMDDSDSVFELDIYDGETATRVKTVTMAEDSARDVMVPAKGFRIRSTPSWARITPREPRRATSGSARSRGPIPSWPTGWSTTAGLRVREPATAPISRLGSRPRQTSPTAPPRWHPPGARASRPRSREAIIP